MPGRPSGLSTTTAVRVDGPHQGGPGRLTPKSESYSSLPASDGVIDMAYAVVMEVQLGNDEPEAGLRMLNEMVIPHAKSQPGYQNGIWMRSPENLGLGVVVFETEENAKAAEEALKQPPGGPQLLSVKTYEVGAQA